MKNAKETITKQKPSKVPMREVKREKEEVMSEEGTPIGNKPKKKSKGLGIVALKHKAVLNTLMRNKGKQGKKATMVQAMIDQGYSRNYAESSTIKKSLTWNQLVEKYLPDELLADTHHELLKASKLDYMLFTPDIKDEEIYALLESKGIVPKKIIHGIQGTHVWFFLPDNKIRKDATELGYKVKKKLTEVIELTNPLEKMSDAELAAVIARQTKKLTKKD